MKTAILSMQKVINYGSILQAYSLQNIMKDITDEMPVFIDVNTNKRVPIDKPLTCDEADYGRYELSINLIPRFIIHKLKNRIKEKEYVKKIIDFQNTMLHLDNSNNQNNYELVVIGSDEVFKCSSFLTLQLYGKVDNAKHVISYAASCGQTDFCISEEYLNIVKKCMARFESMSVRDEHTASYISKLYTGRIERHLDPVLVGCLRSKKHNAINLKNYILIYSYSERIRQKKEILSILEFAKKHGLKTISVGGKQYWTDIYIPLSPFEMLDYFYNATYVVTDTFHGSVFSIINECNFAVLIRQSNSNKLNNLLEKLGLTDRIVKDINNLQDVLKRNISYKNVNKILDEEQKRTYQYLMKCIQSVSEHL